MFYLIYYKESVIVHRPFKSLLSVIKFVETNYRQIIGIHSDGKHGYNNTEFKTQFSEIKESSLLVLTKCGLLGDPREGAYQVDIVIPRLSPLTAEELIKRRKIFRAVPFESLDSLECTIKQHIKVLKKSIKKEETFIANYLDMCEDKFKEYHENIYRKVLEVTTATKEPLPIKDGNEIDLFNELAIRGKELRGIFELINELEILRETTKDNYRLLRRICEKYNICN